MKKLAFLSAFLFVTACGVGGPPVPPGSEQDPRVMEVDAEEFFT